MHVELNCAEMIHEFDLIVCETKRKSPNHAVDQNDLSQEFEGNGLMSQLLLEVSKDFIN